MWIQLKTFTTVLILASLAGSAGATPALTDDAVKQAAMDAETSGVTQLHYLNGAKRSTVTAALGSKDNAVTATLTLGKTVIATIDTGAEVKPVSVAHLEPHTFLIVVQGNLVFVSASHKLTGRAGESYDVQVLAPADHGTFTRVRDVSWTDVDPD